MTDTGHKKLTLTQKQYLMQCEKYSIPREISYPGLVIQSIEWPYLTHL